MMGRGADGGCGTEERPCPVSRSQPSAPSRPPYSVDLLSQVRKSLADRSPFASTEEYSRVPTLPVALATALARHGDSRRRRPHVGEDVTPAKAHVPSPRAGVWDETEEFFRNVELGDVELLSPQLPLSDDVCLRVPLAVVAYQASLIEESVGGIEAENGYQEHEDMEIDDVGSEERGKGGAAGALEEQLVEESSPPSLNWLLGSKHRVLLTSEQPNKKRKLLGSQAGLERLLRLPMPPERDDGMPVCDYCCNHVTGNLVCCKNCKTVVHRKCYGAGTDGGEAWVCSRCKYFEVAGKPLGGDVEYPCLVCPRMMGAMKPIVEKDGSTDKEKMGFVHLFCSLWTPELYVEDIEVMEPVRNIERIPEMQRKLVCNVCKVKHGACVRCSNGACRVSFHPSCARDARHRMEIWGKVECDDVELRAFCAKHTHVEESSLDLRNPTVADGESSRKINDIPLEGDTENNKKQDELTVNIIPHLYESSDGSMGASDHGNDNCLTSFSKHILVLKMLTEKGKIKICDIETGTGISSDALESAIQGDFGSLSSDMQLKLIRWVQNSVHVGVSPRCLESRNDAGFMNSKMTVDCHVDIGKDFDVSAGINISEGEASDVIVKSLPPQRRMKINLQIFNKNEVKTPITVAVVQEDLPKENCSGTILDSDAKETCIYGSNTGRLDGRKENEMLGSHAPCATSSGIPPSREFLLGKDVIRLSSTGSGINVVKSISGSYIHPWIEKRLIEIGCLPTKHHLSGYKKIMSMDAAEIACNGQPLSQPNNVLVSGKSDDDIANEDKIWKILAKVKELGTTDLSPEDELEGEILSLQNKLLDASLALKSHYHDFVIKVATRLPKEIDALNKQRWDMILVHQFLREVREAKKHSRKQRRHREAQAILAAATAAAAPSRVLSLRKDAKDKTEHAGEENKAKVGDMCTNLESHSPWQRRKEKPPKLAVSKLAQGKQADATVTSCDICEQPETLMKPVFVCGGCKVAVHLDCYRKGKDPISSWYCEPCELLKSDSGSFEPFFSKYRDQAKFVPQCGFCGTTTGALRKATDGKWVHALCAEWVLGTRFQRGQEGLVEGVDKILKSREILSCYICHQNLGVCIKCCYGHCQSAFHPICARDSGLFMSVKTSGGNAHHKAYCDKHSEEQREKAEFQHGIEELKNLRLRRVELEKLRLLCERIIKREKLKRELVIHSHDILALRRNYVAMSVLAHSSFVSSGFSSESATTSINNTTYSGTIEKSDDVTIDSTVSGKRRAIPPLHIRLDRTTEVPTRSNSVSTRAMIDRTFSGKQLPERPPSYHKATNDGKRLSKRVKQRETLKKEMVISEQSSIQNQRLPKGFVYVPLENMSKSQDLDSCETQPDG